MTNAASLKKKRRLVILSAFRAKELMPPIPLERAPHPEGQRPEGPLHFDGLVLGAVAPSLSQASSNPRFKPGVRGGKRGTPILILSREAAKDPRPTTYRLRPTVRTNIPVAAGVKYVTRKFIGYSQAGCQLMAKNRLISASSVMP